MALMVRYLILLGISAAAILVHGQPNSQGGFISIDCGISEDYSYTDGATHIVYTSDASYISTGTNHNISMGFRASSLEVQQWTLRSFPTGARNCYTLKPVDEGYKYLVRAFFMYGNYDGENSAGNDNPLQFDLYIGVNLWKTVKIYNASAVYTTEVMTVASMGFLSVCLVNTGSGTPFISTLDLRPLKSNMYPYVNASRSLVEYNRLNSGAPPDQTVRYPDDPYDRIWKSWNYEPYWAPISTTSTVAHLPDDEFEVPSAVLRTAVTLANESELNFYWTDEPVDTRAEYMLNMHFAELVALPALSTRTFNILLNGKLWFGPFTPSYLLARTICSNDPGTLYQYNFTLTATNTSTLPPILNALEIFTVLRLSQLDTDSSDTDAINAIKKYFQVERNWMGDPCVPTAYAWDGLNCAYNISGPPRITTLNLSSSGLAGEIPAFIANLRALRYLDLSNNNLTGKVPDSLAELSFLQLLNLTGNHLTAIPDLLCERAANQPLILSVNIEDNPDICNKEGSYHGKRTIAAPIIAIISIAATALLLLVAVSVWRMRRSRTRQGSASSTLVEPHEEDYSLGPTEYEESTNQFESRQFTYVELKNITNNFERVIGEGGFGTVYHGYLPTGAQVAVKMHSLSSPQGTKEFLAEAQLLTRVHHRNLVSLVGYCKDENYMALIYEYMAQGSLQEHLKDKGGNAKTLSWSERLRIAHDAAQGLEYLHRGCLPPIIHRDVKTSNILLNEKLHAKLADFGLSKSFQEAATHVSTVVVGTPGYLDPEYYNTYQLCEKSDVYSFGVVLLELITGQPAILTGPENCHIIQWVRTRLARGNIADMVDMRLQGEYNPDSVWKVADIAVKCTMPASTQRPTMTNVVIQLKEALELEAFLGTSQNLHMEDLDSDQTVFIDFHGGQMNSLVVGPAIR